MVASKLEILVDFGPKPDQNVVDKTLNMLRAQEQVKEAVFKEGAIVIDTTLPSSQVLDMVTETSGKRAVLQGFGESISAVAMLSNEASESRVVGVVRFQQVGEGALIVDGTVDGLTPGLHGLHVRTSGDLSQGCAGLGPHYSPVSAPHGSPADPAPRRHAGDLGNVRADGQGRAVFRILDSVLKVQDIIGRSLAVTERADDLGRGSSPSSHIDGDSGKPVACGIIARSAGVLQNPKRICQCDGVVVWDEKDRPVAGRGRRGCCNKERGKGDTNTNCYYCFERHIPHYVRKGYKELRDYTRFANLCCTNGASLRKFCFIFRMYKEHPERFKFFKRVYLARDSVKMKIRYILFCLITATSAVIIAKVCGIWVLKEMI